MDADLLDRVRTALRDHDAETLRTLFAEHAELRARVNDPVFPFDSPALVHFASSEDVELIDVLLEFGADPNRRSDWWAGGFHPLHGASDAVAERLIAAGAVPDACAAAHLDRPELLARLIAEDPARVHERGGDGQTPLHFARSRAVVDLLLDAGADPDVRDVDHRATPAQWMLDRRRELAAYLVERGATADIFLAAALGLTDRVRDMLRHDPSLHELRTTQGEYGEKPPSSYHIYMWTIGADLSPLQVAALSGQTDTLRVMRERATPRQRLLAALAGGDATEARLLLSRDAQLMESLQPEDGRLLAEAGWSGNTAAVELMLELDFDPLVGNANGATVLHCAAWQGAAACVAAVLRHPAASALVNLREPVYGATPLGWCCHGSCHGPRGEHAVIARMLLVAGAENSAEMSAQMSAEVREVLRS